MGEAKRKRRLMETEWTASDVYEIEKGETRSAVTKRA